MGSVGSSTVAAVVTVALLAPEPGTEGLYSKVELIYNFAVSEISQNLKFSLISFASLLSRTDPRLRAKARLHRTHAGAPHFLHDVG